LFVEFHPILTQWSIGRDVNTILTCRISSSYLPLVYANFVEVPPNRYGIGHTTAACDLPVHVSTFSSSILIAVRIRRVSALSAIILRVLLP
jgi:hypothetical protein